jgi:heat shock protein HslJ
MSRWLAVIAVLSFILTACGGGGGSGDPAPPSRIELAHATYHGVNVGEETITLEGGAWEGAPFDEGAATRPSVTLLDTPHLTGDLNGDGADEAIALLSAWPGGTGRFLHLAVMGRGEAGTEQLAIQSLGDRVQVRHAVVTAGRVELDLVVGGPADAACCPGDLVRRAWRLDDGTLQLDAETPQGRLSPEAIAGVEWRLLAWAYGDPAPEEPPVTLRYQEGKFVGRGGCNQYFTEVTAGPTPAEIATGPVGSTRMACPDPAGEIEARFLGALERVSMFSFLGGRLVLSYEKDGDLKGLVFERMPSAS